MTAPSPFNSHRPEDRQRNGACDVGWAQTAPMCFRSEAFAEDLAATPSGVAMPPRALVQDRARPWMPVLGLAVATWLGIRSS
jgi:hypothetical protein